jgi:spoIIIJ-associated protein
MDEPPNPSTEPSLENYLSAIQSLVEQIIRHGGFEISCAVRQGKPTEPALETPEFVVEFSGPDAELLLERGGALLDALEYLVLKAVRLDEELFGRITFDCQDWRWLRARELQLAARVAAERVAETGDSFALNPMPARERRIVHLALRDLPAVRTASEGFGPQRKVVIHPASPQGRRA